MVDPFVADDRESFADAVVEDESSLRFFRLFSSSAVVEAVAASSVLSKSE